MATETPYLNDQSEAFDDKITGSATSQKSNALSNKISHVLASSYADPEIRDALQTLDERKIENTPEARRKLRIDAQKEVIDRNSDVVQDFGLVAEQLKRIGSTIVSLNQCCEQMKLQVAAARRENAPVLEEASTLLRQKRELEAKKQILNAFNQHFILSEEDLSVLTGSPEKLDDQFFSILRRTKRIHDDCQILLGSENQRLGMELMEQSSRHLNMGYQKLFRWTQKELKNVNLENPHISSIIRRALRALSERPALFQGCLDFFAEAREHVLTDAFYSALTGSSNSNDQNQMMKPIEFHAHDPLRYVGDMLAWIHSTTVSEREALENLFVSEGAEFKKGFEAGREAEPWSVGDSEGFDGQKALGDLVNRDVAGVSRALRQRVEQVLQNHEDPVLLYKIRNLINFYHITFTKLVGSDSSLLDTFGALEDSALRHFRTILSENANATNSDLATIPPDLSMPGFLDESLTHFAEILKSYDASLAPPEARASEFEPIVQVAIDPFISACEKMSKELDEPDNRVFLTNCLLAAQSIFSKHDFVQERHSKLTTQLEDCTANLTEYQHAFFVHTSGLHPILIALAALEDSEKALSSASNLPALRSQALSDASQTLDDFLPSALMDAMENVKRLSSKAVAQEITAEAADRFCEDFEFVEGRLVAIDQLKINSGNDSGAEDPEDREGSELDGVVLLKSLFPRTSGEIRVLLS